MQICREESLAAGRHWCLANLRDFHSCTDCTVETDAIHPDFRISIRFAYAQVFTQMGVAMLYNLIVQGEIPVSAI